MVYILKPAALRRAPMEAVAIPLPKLEQTPPVTKIYLVGMGTVYQFCSERQDRSALFEDQKKETLGLLFLCFFVIHLFK